MQGRDINLDIGQIVGHRQFCNKLWQATQFVMMYLDGYAPTGSMVELIDSLVGCTGRDKWILSRLNTTIEAVTAFMQDYQFSYACQATYDFWQKDFCDNFIVRLGLAVRLCAYFNRRCVQEMSKPALRGSDEAAKLQTRKILLLCLEIGLRLLHPFMPFVTEELWQHLPNRGLPWDASQPDPPSIVVSAWPYPVCRY